MFGIAYPPVDFVDNNSIVVKHNDIDMVQMVSRFIRTGDIYDSDFDEEIDMFKFADAYDLPDLKTKLE